MATRWGIFTAGKIAHDFTTCLRSLDPAEHQVVAVAARNINDAQKFAVTHKIPRVYGSYEELGNDPEVDVVYIGTVATRHLQAAKMMLEAGKNVLLEKPFTLTSKGARELVELARSKKLFLMEAIWSRFNPIYTFLREKIQTKALGDLLSINVTFGDEFSNVPRMNQKATGGGSLLDLGVYTLNAIQTCTENKKPVQILATGHLNKDGVDETISVALKYPDGQVAMMSNTIRGVMTNEAHIVFTKGVLKIFSPFWCPTKIVMLTGPNLSKEEVFEIQVPKVILDCNFTNSGFLTFEAQHVRECLLKGLTESPILPLDDTLTIREIADEILKQVGVQFDE